MKGLRRIVLALVAGIALVFEGALLLLSGAFLLKWYQNSPLIPHEIPPQKGLIITLVLLVCVEVIRQKIKQLIRQTAE